MNSEDKSGKQKNIGPALTFLVKSHWSVYLKEKKNHRKMK